MKIPRSNAGGTRLTTQSGVAPKDPGQMSQVSRAVSGLGKVVQEVAQKFETLASENEKMKAKNHARQRLMALEQQAIDDPDAWNTAKYTSEMAKIKEESSAMISLPVHKNIYGNEYDALSQVSSAQINNTLRKKQIINTTVEMFDSVDLMGEEYASTLDPRIKAMKIKDMEETFRTGIELGLLTPIQARSNIEAQKKKWVEQDIRNKIAEDPDLAEELLLSDAWDLSSDEAADWGDAIEDKRKKNKIEAENLRKSTHLTNAGELTKNLKGTSVQDATKMFTDDLISAKTFEQFANWKTDPDLVNAETDREIWLEMVRDSHSPELDMIAFQDRIGKAMENGEIKFDDGANLTLTMEKRFQTATNFKTAQQNVREQNLTSAFDYFKRLTQAKGVSKEDSLFQEFDLVKRLLEKTENAADEKIPEIARDIAKDQVRADNPSTVGLDDVPNAVANADKGVRPVYKGDTEQKAEVKLKEPKNDKDSFGFVVGEQRQGHEYIGNNEWQKI